MSMMDRLPGMHFDSKGFLEKIEEKPVLDHSNQDYINDVSAKLFTLNEEQLNDLEAVVRNHSKTEILNTIIVLLNDMQRHANGFDD